MWSAEKIYKKMKKNVIMYWEKTEKGCWGMNEKDKTRHQLAEEIAQLKNRIEALEIERKGHLKQINEIMRLKSLQRKQAEKNLWDRVKFERAIFRMSSRFLNDGDIDRAIDLSLKDIIRLRGASRVCLFRLRENGKIVSNTYEQCAPGVSPQIDKLRNVPAARIPWILGKLSKGEVIQIKDISQLPPEAGAERKWLGEQQIISTLLMPLMVKEKLLGFVGLDNVSNKGPWHEDSFRVLRLFSEVLANALERKEYEHQLKVSEAYHRTIFETTRTPMIILDQYLNIIHVNQRFKENFGLNNEEFIEKTKWETFINQDDWVEITKQIKMKEDHSFEVLSKDREIRISDRYGKKREFYLNISPIPNTPKYVVSISDITALKETQRQLENSLSILESSLESTTRAISRLVEVRDPYTAGHQQNVARLAVAVAEHMGFTQETIKAIQIAALLHDIGKIYVPAEILTKPGFLDENEFSLIKAHPKIGFDIFKEIEFPWPIADIVLQHHEKLDGSGYPFGLSNDSIMMEARILCVADVVDAMMSHRPYRPSLGEEAVLNELYKGKGVLYDPDVVDTYIKYISQPK